MPLCCDVNPTKTCKTCKNKFCEDHVYTESMVWLPATPSSECFECYDKERRTLLDTAVKGMSAKELFLTLRKICPTGSLTIECRMTDYFPGLSSWKFEWTVYSDKIKGSIKGETPEVVLEVFKKKIEGLLDPREHSINQMEL